MVCDSGQFLTGFGARGRGEVNDYDFEISLHSRYRKVLAGRSTASRLWMVVR